MGIRGAYVDGKWVHDPTYSSWHSMIQRCDNPRTNGYERYGGRGIEVCARWYSFENFLEDMGPRPQGKTLDRIDNNGNYELANCKWSTLVEQQANRAEFSHMCKRGHSITGDNRASYWSTSRNKICYQCKACRNLRNSWRYEKAL